MTDLDSTINLIMVKAHSAIAREFSRKEKLLILSEIISLAESQVHNAKTKSTKEKTQSRTARAR